MRRAARGFPSHFIRRVVARGALFWALMHVVLLVFRAVVMRDGATHPTEYLQPDLPVAFLFTAALSAVEMGIRREWTFVSNLAVNPQWLIIIPAFVAVMLDTMLHIIL